LKQAEARMMDHAVGTLLARLRDWWRTQDELGLLDPKEMGRIAGDLGLSRDALKEIVARGPDAAHLVYERMQTLGISKADVDHAAHGVLRDLQRTCALCNDKAVCERDLARRPDDPAWKRYCPNAVTLQTLAALKAQLSSGAPEADRDRQ
jgi:hypothetical protein